MRSSQAGFALALAVLVTTPGCEFGSEGGFEPTDNTVVMGTRIAMPASGFPVTEMECDRLEGNVSWLLGNSLDDTRSSPIGPEESQAIQSPGFDDGEPPEPLPAYCQFTSSADLGSGVFNMVIAQVEMPGAAPWSQECQGFNVGWIDEASFVTGWTGFTHEVSLCIASDSSQNNYGKYPSPGDPNR